MYNNNDERDDAFVRSIQAVGGKKNIEKKQVIIKGIWRKSRCILAGILVHV